MGLFDRFRRKENPSSQPEEPQSTEAGDPGADSATAGDAATGDAATGDSATGDSATGDAATGDAATGDSATGDSGGGGWLTSIRRGLKKTADLLNTDIRDLFKREGRLVDDEFLSELFAILIRTDMGAGPAKEIRERIQGEYRGRVVHMEDVLATVAATLSELLQQPERPIEFAAEGPTVILVVGVNGSGKTTSIAKLAHHFHNEQGKRVILGAGDTFRAAAVEQLTIWSQRIGCDIVTGQTGADPASVAHRAVAQALEQDAEVCIIDTAGRLQTQVNLMQELAKIRRVIGKLIPDAPHEVLLVLDATAGQNGISQAKGFSDAAECTGLVLAKLDGTAKGGVVIPIRQQFDLPVKYIGLGEKETDFALFNVNQFVEALFPDPQQTGSGRESH